MKFITVCIAFFLLVHIGFAQDTTVKGEITDSEGNPVSNATISSSLESVQTGADGSFEIKVIDLYVTLSVRKPGFSSGKISLNGTTTANLSIVPSSDKMVSTGFGSVSKSELTSSISQIDGGSFSNKPVVDIEQSSQGRAAGVFVQNNGGKLGEGTTVRIRGGSSLTASNAPLYVVDGVPLASENQSNINPGDIASMEILKDASAAAIYGSRAANGVVLITTKSGQSGKMKVDVDYQFGFSQTPKKLDLYSPNDYRAQIIDFGLRSLQDQLALVPGADAIIARQQVEDIISEASAGTLSQWAANERITLADGTTYDFNNGQYGQNDIFQFMANTLDSNRYDTDWQDEVFRTALSHRANINLSGGSDKIQYFAGASYMNQEGILIGNQFERFNGRLNLKSELSSKASLNANLSYAHVVNNKLNDDADLGSPLQGIVLPPSDTYEASRNDSLVVRKNEYNPLAEIRFSDNLEYSDQFIGNLSFNYDISDQLLLTLEGGADYFSSSREHRQGPETLEGKPTGLSSVGTDKTLSYIGTAYLTYNFGADKGNNGSAVVGTSYQRSLTSFTYRELRANSIDEVNEASNSNPNLLNSPIPGSGYIYASAFTRVNYTIQGKYLFQISGRLDGSSRFSPDNQYGFFPAASAGWNIHEEGFFSGIGFMSLLKLKGSYGLVGNTPDDDFLYRTNYFIVNYGVGPQVGYRLSNLENNSLKWETTHQADFGLEMGFVDDRIFVEINAYSKTTEDLLFPRPVSLTSGFSNSLSNIGTLINQGLEFSISTLNVDTDNFSWSTDFNIATNKNEIEDIGGDTLVLGVNAYLEGEPAGAFFMPEYLGVNQTTGEAEYADKNGFPTTDYDKALTGGRSVVGNPNPKFFGGLSNTLSLGNFELNFLFQFVYGSDIYFATGEFLSNSGILNLSQSKDQLNRWYNDQDADAEYPVINPTQDNTYPSSRWIQDGSYIRLNNLSLTYNFPQELTSKMKLSNLSIYVGGQNLITFTKYTGYDPDVAYVDPEGGSIGENISRGNDYFTTPQARTVTAGIKIGF